MTDYPAQIQALLDQYAAEQSAPLVAQIAALTAHVADLKAQVVALTPPPPAPSTLFGSAVQPNAGETYAAGFARLERTMGRLPVRRVYDSAQGLGVALDRAASASPAGETVVVSWKDPPATVNSGARDDYYRAQFKRTTGNLILCYAHEQDMKINHGEYSAADFLAAWRRLHDLWREVGGKGRWIQIFTGFNFAQRLAPQYVGDDYTDMLGVDPYAQPGQSAIQLVQPLLDTAAKVTAKPVAVCEIGGFYAPQSAAFVQSLAALKGKVPFVLWFNSQGSGPGGDYRIDQLPDHAAAYRALS